MIHIILILYDESYPQSFLIFQKIVAGSPGTDHISN